MPTFANRERLRDRARHFDLLEPVASSTAERDEVRHLLGTELQRQIAALPPLTEADLDAQEAFKRAPWPTTQHNHAHRYSACRSGPCEQGRKLCPSPQACQLDAANEAAAREPRPAPLRIERFAALTLLVASVLTVAAVLGVLSWGAF